MFDLNSTNHVIDGHQEPIPCTRSVLTMMALIGGAMVVGASVVALTVLSIELALLGFCVAFSMMLFIGLPLMLASFMDAVEAANP